MDSKSFSPGPLLLSAGIVLLLAVAYGIWPAFQEGVHTLWSILQSGDYQRMSAWFRDFGIWGPLGLIGAMVVQMFLIVLPSWGLMVVAVMAYGPIWGFVLAVAAVLAASAIGYGLGRWLGIAALEQLLGRSSLEQVGGWVERYGFWGVFLFRLSPLLSSDAISIVAGLFRMSFGQFMLATLAGIAPLALAIAYFGESADKLKTGLYVLGGLGLLLYGLYIYLDQRRKKEPADEEDPS